MSEIAIQTVELSKAGRSAFRWVVWTVIIATSAVLTLGAAMGWIPFGLVEVFGFVSGAVCVMLTAEENIWNWPIGLVNNIFFIILFLDKQLFADMSLQFVYIILTVVGWYRWLRGGANHGKLAVSRVDLWESLILVAITIAGTAGMTIFLESVKDSAPFLDALTTVLSLVAQYLLTRKAFENWFVWITADIIYVAMYSVKGLYLTAILYALFIVLCVGGLRIWHKSLKQAALVAQPGVST